jgi:hypothetical protein
MKGQQQMLPKLAWGQEEVPPATMMPPDSGSYQGQAALRAVLHSLDSSLNPVAGHKCMAGTEKWLPGRTEKYPIGVTQAAKVSIRNLLESKREAA